jgi:hypothetical protein
MLPGFELMVYTICCLKCCVYVTLLVVTLD